jgi:tungstate transport system substrate-binding protein
MKQRLISLAVWAVIISFASLSSAQDQAAGVYGAGPDKFSIATGSPGELGLLKALADAFTPQTNSTLLWIKAGSGESLKMFKEKTVDLIMSHSPGAEQKAVAEGWATQRTLIGSNEFFIVGPAEDPAQVAAAQSAADAYTRIATAKAKFFSRGDNSGTHKKEQEIWQKVGITPAGDWYLVTHEFMIATLKRTNDEKGYFMTDSSTWVAEKNHLANLKVLFRGDKLLVNVYHALCQPAGATPGAARAARFIEFVASPRGQEIIRGFGKAQYGEGLYNDAAYAKQYEE